MIVKIGKRAGIIILASAIVGILLLGALAARLAMGPIPMAWAVPYIESAMQSEGGIPAALNVTDMALAWNPDTRHIEFTAHHVTVTQQLTQLTAVDQVGMTFSALALLRGQLQLKDLTLAAPHFEFTLGAQNSAAPDTATGDMVASSKNVLRHLHSILVRGGAMTLHHAGTGDADVIDHVELKWQRNLWSSAGTLSANLHLAGSTADSPLHAELKENQNGIQISSSAKNIMPGDLQFILDRAAPGLLPANLAPNRWQMATSLDTHMLLTPNGALENISGTLSVASGQVMLPEFYSGPVPLGNLVVKGQYDAVHGNWQVDKFNVMLQDADGNIPMTFAVDGNSQLHNIHADATLENLNVAQLKRWWPNSAAPGAIEWLGKNLKDGKIPQLTASADLHAADRKNYDVTRVAASWDMQNMTTTFLPGFPPVTGINGKAVMDASTVHFNIQSGHLNDIVLQPSTMDVTGLDADDQILNVDFKSTAQVPTVLKLLDTAPYQYIKKMGIDAATASGGVGMDLKMAFPLLAALKISDIKYHAIANLSQVALPHMLLGKDVTHGQGVLEIDPEHMKVNGQADISGVPLEFTWQDFALPKDGVSRQVTFSSELLDDDHARLGLPTAGRVAGSTKLTGSYEARGAQSDLHAQMDFREAAVHVDELSYTKPSGAPMMLTADMVLGNQTTFKVGANAKDLTIAGTGTLDGAMNPVKLDFPAMKLGKTDVQFNFDQTGTAQRWSIDGSALDIGQLIANNSGPAKNTAPVTEPQRSVQIKLGTLYLANQNNMKNFAANLHFNGQDWDKVMVQGELHASAPFTINWDANGAGRKLQVRTPDAGAALSALDVTTAMIGGDLAIDGTGDAPGTHWLAHGKFLVKNFRMREVPLLGRLIAAVSPGELLDKLRGRDGVGFDSLEGNFDYNDSTLHLDGGKAHGQAIGITFAGDVNHASAPTTLKIDGTFVPLYMVNGALAGVPIIGSLINGKDGGGLLGFNYSATGTAADPSVSVNPLSAFAPGFLRDLFF